MHEGERRNSRRKRSPTPDKVEQGERPDREKPRADRDEPRDRGRNEEAETVREDATEKIRHEHDKARWGTLPDYLDPVKTRGAQPDVPERYRKFREAFLKQARERSDERDR